jgi:hypothetical protein
LEDAVETALKTAGFDPAAAGPAKTALNAFKAVGSETTAVVTQASRAVSETTSAALGSRMASVYSHIGAATAKAEEAAGAVTGITKGLSISGKVTAGISKVLKAISTGIEKIPVVGAIEKWVLKFGNAVAKSGIGRLIGTSAKFIFTKVLVVYAVIDGLVSAVTEFISKDLTIEPGLEVKKTDTATPFTLKASKSISSYYQMSAITEMKFSLKGGGLGIPGTQGGLLELTWTGHLDQPPTGLMGFTYKCVGTCGNENCVDNKLAGCTCYPISNAVDMTLDKTGTSTDVIRSGLASGT